MYHFLSCSFELSIENAEMYKEEEKETKIEEVVKMVLLNTIFSTGGHFHLNAKFNINDWVTEKSSD